MSTDSTLDGMVKSSTGEGDGKPQEISTAFSVPEMTCLTCIYQIKEVLRSLPGISNVKADLETRVVTIKYNPGLVEPSDLQWAMKENGYETEIVQLDEESQNNNTDQRKWFKGYHSIVMGIAASLVVLSLYLGLMTVTSSWINAKSLFLKNQWWIIALSVGLGVQVALYSIIRSRFKNGTAKKGLAASGGLSTASMAACCSHYAVAILPALGLPFLSSAVAGIELIQTPLFIIGIISNLIGITIMLRIMVHSGIISNETVLKFTNFRNRRIAA